MEDTTLVWALKQNKPSIDLQRYNDIAAASFVYRLTVLLIDNDAQILVNRKTLSRTAQWAAAPHRLRIDPIWQASATFHEKLFHSMQNCLRQ